MPSEKLRAVVLAGVLVGCSSQSPGAGGPLGPSQGGNDAASGDAAGSDAAREDASAADAGGAQLDSSGDGPGDAASPPDAGTFTDTGRDVDFVLPTPVCDPTVTWGAGAVLGLSTAGDDQLVSVTPDEQTIAWVVTQGASRTIYWADSSGGSFGTPQTIDATPFANERAALSPDGLRLEVVNAGGQGFSELTRSAVGGSFGAPAVGAFSNLNAQGALAAGESYGDPIVSSDDRTFYYSRYGGGRTATVFQTGRIFSTDPWSTATTAASSAAALMAQGAADGGLQRRRPTGISADELTLFYWDEVTSIERAAWIGMSGDFQTFVDLGSRSGAEPNAACTTLYYSAQGTSSIDLFKASAN